MTKPEPSPAARLFDIARKAMQERGLLPDFSPAALTEIQSLSGPATAPDQPVCDLRQMLWASIDNDDSRDLDQLSVAGDSKEGSTTILVAIADVDALVRRGSAVDEHARANTTSVYTAAAVFPMLPLKLSTDLTSLNEAADRLAIVVEFAVSAEGEVSSPSISRALVRNHAKLAYNGVAAWLNGAAPAPARLAAVPGLEEQIRTQNRVAQSMKGLRHRRGALSLASAEARPVFDGERLVDLRLEDGNCAKELIEEFMVAANGAAANFLHKSGMASLRRVLHSPERWERIVSLARGLGEKLPATPDGTALEGFLLKRSASDPGGFADLSLAVIKLLGSGEYAVEPPGGSIDGHFGLAVGQYTHSTAPNRRYPDLVTQRLLKAALAGEPPPYGKNELEALALHCTEQENNAAKVERQVRKSAAAMLLANRTGERFDAIVTGASEKGTWVRTTHPAAEGRLIKRFEGLGVGDHIRVELVHTDVERGFVDFARV